MEPSVCVLQSLFATLTTSPEKGLRLPVIRPFRKAPRCAEDDSLSFPYGLTLPTSNAAELHV